MRFLCEQCKAKYQIADEKVAGKTVRMKCRKCGHLIEVKAEVTETSVSTRAPAPDDGDNDATRVGMDVNAMMQLSKGGGPAATTKPSAPRPAAGAMTKPATKPAMATSLAHAPKPAKPAAPPQKESALAGAFTKTVAKDERLEISTSSEWYCAINGVPVGPVRIAELRRKASTGAVTEESLVWQEGMEEWRPLRTIPELVAIVQEGLSAERPSLVSANPPRVTPAPPAPSPRGAATKTPTPAPAAPSAFGAPMAQQRSNVIPLAGRLATAEKLDPEPIADPFAMPISVAAAPAPISTDMPSTAAGVAAPTVVIPRKQGPNWIVIGMVVAFGAFGATAGVAVFFNKAPPAATVIVAATQTTATPTAATATGGPVAMVDTANPATSGDPGTTTRPAGTGGAVRTNANPGTATTGTTKAVDPSIAALLGNSTAGPSVGGGSGGGGASSALSEEAIQRVVQQRSAGVKRTCWERGGGTESNVNVRVHLTIAATGNVQNASADGNDPIVSKCIEGSVRNWQFPASSGPTTVDIPFHFLRQ
jgi:predicted Zn finger-like uncharacterized protein